MILPDQSTYVAVLNEHAGSSLGNSSVTGDCKPAACMIDRNDYPPSLLSEFKKGILLPGKITGRRRVTNVSSRHCSVLVNALNVWRQ